MTAPVEPAIARPQGGTSVLERAAIFLLWCSFVFFFFFFYLFARRPVNGCGKGDMGV